MRSIRISPLAFTIILLLLLSSAAVSQATVVLRDGDARSFADKPDVIAYANTEYITSPAEFQITTSGTIWRYYQWIALDSYSWVEAKTTVDTTSIGVQLWGDTNDGWARVLVDGSEVWKGDTYGADTNYPGKAFVKYLEITGLTSGKHTIRVESTGIIGPGGGGDVTIFFFGLRKISKITPSATITGFSGLIFESRNKSSGSTVQIPLTLLGVKDKIGNMDITLGYNSSVLEATDVVKGSLTANSLFDYNIPSKGTIKISLADKEGFSGDGSVAQIVFNVIGANGSFSPLKISSLSANKADLTQISIPTSDGLFTVIGADQCRGDCNGDGKITALDALCALQMSVGKKKEDLSMDVNEDGKVTSLDAREILKNAVRSEQEPSIEAMKMCQPGEKTTAMGENIDIQVFIKIKGEVNGNCEIYEKVVKDNTDFGVEGKEMTCLIPLDAMAGKSTLGDNIRDYCKGSLADAIAELMG